MAMKKLELLDAIDGPGNLKELPVELLPELADEIRRFIIENVSKTGGHLASSLGAVELAIAVHYTFNSPDDDIVWDVGHQAYAHKIITGRRNSFSTLRQFHGISGFPKPSESLFDAFGVGHASTSISAALGMAVGHALNKEDKRSIAIIGDGSMTAGIAFEGLDHAGHIRKDLIVILNDNEMSISRNVGALSNFLSRKITSGFALKIKREIQNLFDSIPLLGKRLVSIAKRAEDSLITLFTPGMLFEGMGFNYIGPIDGHDINALVATLSEARKLEGPVLVHVLTKKGKGYKFAEDNPSSFHGVGPFDIKTGKANGKKTKSYTSVFSEALTDMASKNRRIVAITAAMPGGTGLELFARKYPERFFDVGIAEQHAVTFAAGLATTGLIPVTAIYSTFLQRAYDQVFHDVCLQNLHVVFALDRAGIVGQDGSTHHGLFDLSYLRHIPNMIIMCPRNEEELRRLLLTAVNYNGPSTIRYPRGQVSGVDISDPIAELPVGKGEILRKGKDITILAVGATVDPSVEAAESIERKTPYKVGVANCRFVKPLDEKLIISVAKKRGKLCTIEENTLEGGFGSSVLELLAREGIRACISRIGVPDRFVEHGSQKELRHDLGLDAEGIEKRLLDILNAD